MTAKVGSLADLHLTGTTALPKGGPLVALRARADAGALPRGLDLGGDDLPAGDGSDAGSARVAEAAEVMQSRRPPRRLKSSPSAPSVTFPAAGALLWLVDGVSTAGNAKTMIPVRIAPGKSATPSTRYFVELTRKTGEGAGRSSGRCSSCREKNSAEVAASELIASTPRSGSGQFSARGGVFTKDETRAFHRALGSKRRLHGCEGPGRIRQQRRGGRSRRPARRWT